MYLSVWLESSFSFLLEDEQRFGLGILMRQYYSVSFGPIYRLLLVFDPRFIVVYGVFMFCLFVCVL